MIPPSSKGSILIIEDDLDVAEMLNSFFGVQGFNSASVSFGEEGLRSCNLNQPDLVILDVRLPDIDGFEVAKRLRANRRTKGIPIIFLSENKDRETRLKGLELQAEDFITKPFDMQELGVRVINLLQHSMRRSQTSAVTTLPMGMVVDDQLLELVDHPQSAMIIVVMKHFDYFREVYGFIAHDDLLRAVAMMLKEALQEVGAIDFFIGHLKSDAFIINVEPFLLEKTREAIYRRLTQSLEYFYREQDRESGVFKDHPLTFDMKVYLPETNVFKNLNTLKAEIEKQIY
jgi:PleD family two-component response regulator